MVSKEVHTGKSSSRQVQEHPVHPLRTLKDTRSRVVRRQDEGCWAATLSCDAQPQVTLTPSGFLYHPYMYFSRFHPTILFPFTSTSSFPWPSSSTHFESPLRGNAISLPGTLFVLRPCRQSTLHLTALLTTSKRDSVGIHGDNDGMKPESIIHVRSNLPFGNYSL